MKLMEMRERVADINDHLSVLQSQSDIHSSIQSLVSVMSAMNKEMGGMSSIALDFERQATRLTSGMEQLEDGMEDVFDSEFDDEETDKLEEMINSEIELEFEIRMVDPPRESPLKRHQKSSASREKTTTTEKVAADCDDNQHPAAATADRFSTPPSSHYQHQKYDDDLIRRFKNLSGGV